MATNKLKIKESKSSTKSESAKQSNVEDNTSDEKDIFNSEGELVVDVFETDSDFVVLAAIAGIQIKDVDISVEEDMMVIKGNRQDPHSHPSKKYLFQECYWGPFSRKIVLPDNIKVEDASAQIDKGLLTIKIPKVASS